ncbi:DsbA family oxidoreductase [Roseovarius sp. E0-M6]|uniref:DsbA family oxidoreductase n=1 Tax=Roseovarius sp. E0-M6 TaxID=3127118 RepID=UPI00300F9ED8
MVRVDIVSDPICPWCYIGKAELDAALHDRPDHPFEIVWHPFQLNPDMPEGGMDRRTYLEAKFGGKDGAVTAYKPVVERAEEAGLDIDFAAIGRTPNTVDAHRLIHWAEAESLQNRVVDALFLAYFREGRDIGDRGTLSEIAGNCGMDAAMVARLFEGPSDIEDVQARDRQFREMGVSGVPLFIVAGRHAVPGCQPKELWLKVIDDIMEQAGQAP